MTKKKAGLSAWKNLFTDGKIDPLLAKPQIQQDLLHIQKLYAIPTTHFTAIIEGCEMDLQPQRFGTWPDLKEYTYRVASSVGLVCLPIFGAKDPQAEKYAITLGHALQLTNILRDIGEDLQNGVRIYLPLHDLARFQYTERDLIGRVHDSRFVAFMTYQSERALALYDEAAALLPPRDHRALVAPRIMHRIYRQLLLKMRADHFQVFTKRYRISKNQKIALLLRELLSPTKKTS